jgi:hypothetical protein
MIQESCFILRRMRPVRPFSSRNVKKMILFLAGAVMIFLFFLLPPYRLWWRERVVTYWKEFLVQRKQLDIEHRKKERFEGHYTYSRQVAAFFEQKGNKQSALVLMPSSAYFKKNGINYEVPEPGVFYLFTGLKTVLISSPNAASANWYVRVCDKKIIVDSLTNLNLVKDSTCLYGCVEKTGTAL